MKKLVLSLSFLLILQCTLTTEYCKGQWYPLPVFPTYLETSDVKFFDENTGVLTLNYTSGFGMLRTTNGGMNWVFVDTSIVFYDLEKIDSNTIYAIGRGRDIIDRVLRSTNRGLNWTSTAYPLDYAFHSCSFINKDTGWVTGFDGSYRIWRTTNGGVTLTSQSTEAARGEVFFYNQKVNGEYIGWVNNVSALWKTTNSGNNWFQVACPGTNLYQITFINENTGWVCGGGMYKTTNGGLNWVNQSLAPGIPNIYRGMSRFYVMNENIIYGAGGYKYYPLRTTALIWRTTNGGDVWGYQEIDTSYHIGVMGPIDFINNQTGWAFGENGVKTTNNGGSFTSIRNNESLLRTFELFQNYPNPFNPTTKIAYDIPRDAKVKLVIYDILGREMKTLVNNEFRSAGKYIAELNGSNLASGIYFSRILVNEGKDFMAVKKMVLVK